MDFTQYLERWAWLGLTLLVFALLSPSAVVVGLALWLWLHWKPQARLRWLIAGLLLLASWTGLVLVWDALTGQLIALREAISGQAGMGTILMRALPVWGEGTLLGPSIAGLVHLFRPQPFVRPARVQQPAQPAVPAESAALPLNEVAQQRTLPSPAVKLDQPQDAPSSLAS